MNMSPAFTMKNYRQRKYGLLCITGLFALVVSCTDATPENSSQESLENSALDFTIVEGKVLNEFYQHGNIASHSLLTSGEKPRLIVAFPAGNSAVSLWFDKTAHAASWSDASNKTELIETDTKGNTLYGLQWQTQITTATLSVEKAVLANVRILRRYLHGRGIPKNVFNERTIEQNGVTWYRLRPDGKSAYKLQLQVLNGSASEQKGKIVFNSNNGKALKFKISALTGDTPLTPIKKDELILDTAADDQASKQVLAFLTYEEKMLAGSWRFLTYFGRDSLLTVRLLMPVLHAKTIEAALGAVIERINDNGEVAHEEDIGDFAVLKSLKKNGKTSAKPFYDYKMRDDNFIFTTVIADYLLSGKLTETQIQAFLAKKTTDGTRYGDKIAANFQYVYQQAAPFLQDTRYQNLISLLEDKDVGDWRDSQAGLGYERYSYSVNAVLIPAALKAIERLINKETLNQYVSETEFSDVATAALTWTAQAPTFFEVDIKAANVNTKLAQYAKEQAVPVAEDLYIGEGKSAQFYALALTAQGKPMPVIQSDIGFSLLLQNPSDYQINRMLATAMKPYPLGLLSPIGLFVANPVFATTDKKQWFTRDAYHGAVVWSWQQALMLSGLNKQLSRTDLATTTMASLTKARVDLLEVLHHAKKDQSKEVRSTELWSWNFDNGKYINVPFGQAAGHHSESNAAQLWSTVYLALPESY